MWSRWLNLCWLSPGVLPSWTISEAAARRLVPGSRWDSTSTTCEPLRVSYSRCQNIPIGQSLRAPSEEHMVLAAVPERGPADCSAHLPAQRKLYLGARPGFGREKERSALAAPSQAWLPVTSSPHPPNSTHCAPGSVHRVETMLSRWLPRYITSVFCPLSLAAASQSPVQAFLLQPVP